VELDAAMDSNSDPLSVGEAFTAHLDREGYSFQYAVLRQCEQVARRPSDQKLSFEVSELPVQTRGRDSRVDFILKSQSVWHSIPLMLVCECKRSNPALSDWCFARAPYIRRNRRDPCVIAETLTCDRNSGTALATAVTVRGEKPYHVGLPVKSGQRGDASGSSTREIIEEAAAQVLRGLNGFADFLKNNPAILEGPKVLLIPVIFTTAKLYTSEVDLGAAELSTGKLPALADVEQVDWLWFQHHVSSSLRHSIPRHHPSDGTMASVGGVLEIEHSRSIAIVGAREIEKFLRTIFHAPDLLDTVR
jgi:hypothetical protein